VFCAQCCGHNLERNIILSYPLYVVGIVCLLCDPRYGKRQMNSTVHCTTVNVLYTLPYTGYSDTVEVLGYSTVRTVPVRHTVLYSNTSRCIVQRIIRKRSKTTSLHSEISEAHRYPTSLPQHSTGNRGILRYCTVDSTVQYLNYSTYSRVHYEVKSCSLPVLVYVL